jgi:hypothetical protein
MTSVIIIDINILIMEFTPSAPYFASLFLKIPIWWPCEGKNLGHVNEDENLSEHRFLKMSNVLRQF